MKHCIVCKFVKAESAIESSMCAGLAVGLQMGRFVSENLLCEPHRHTLAAAEETVRELVVEGLGLAKEPSCTRA